MHWVIAYDITSDRRRRRVAATLERYGYRVQASVFEANLSPAAREALVRQLKAIARGADQVAMYPACEACLARVHRLGRDEGPRPAPLVVV